MRFIRAFSGTLESNDCLITVEKSNKLTIEIESIVKKQFGEQIEQVIKTTLESLNIKTLYVRCEDKGALDYTIEARLITAVKRLGDLDA
ncbi:MAG: citrate lyase acyl carrier protein [Acholeplasmataceae bacterium]